MVRVISSSEKIKNEANIINALFDAGLELFHLRKYICTTDELKAILKTIEQHNLSKIVLHQEFGLANEFGINHFHLSEKDRLATTKQQLHTWKESGILLSTSTHSIEEINTLPPYYDAVFLSPIFNSISKTGYMQKVFQLKKITNTSVKVIALGGIDAETCVTAKKMGFEGIAVLGAIWKNEKPIKEFISIYQQWNTVSQSY